MKQQLNKNIRFIGFVAIAAMSIFAASCDKNDDPEPKVDPVGNHDPITLECDYFSQDRVLTDDPEAPVDYIITCEALVKGSLTIKPGVVIAFGLDAGLRFGEDAGKITMNGTAEKPIVLTGTEHEKGFWAGVLSVDKNAGNSMKYVTIEYAGSRDMQWDWVGGFCTGHGAVMNIDHCTFSNNKGSGIVWDLSNNSADIGYISNSVMTGNDLPMSTSAGYNSINLFNGTNSYTGNVKDYVHIYYSGINDDATWKKIDMPYYVESHTFSRFDLSNDAKLVIEPGTEIIFSSGTKFRVLDGTSLIMVGTPNDKIVLRGMDDVAGAWNHIYIGSSSVLNEIAYVDIRDAGQATGYPNGAVHLESDGYLNIHDVSFSNCFQYGLSLRYGAGGSIGFHLEYDGLSLNNTPKMFSDWDGDEVIDPNNP